MRKPCLFWILLILSMSAVEPQAGEVYRGLLLYENNCHACHYRFLHYRPHREVRSLAELRRRIAISQNEIGLDWDAEDIDDVRAYLNRRYYRFPEFRP